MEHTEDRRLLLHSDVDIQQVLDELRHDISATKQDNLALRRELNATQQSQKVQLEQEINTVKQDSLAQKLQLEREINATKQDNLDLRRKLNATQRSHKAQLQQELNAQKTQLEQEINAQKAQLEQEIGALRAETTQLRKGQGSTYVRWGRTTCPANGTEKVYSGFAAGSEHDTAGGAPNTICLPDSPSWAYYVDGVQGVGGKISGTEYQTSRNSFGKHAFGKSMLNEDVPCVLCHSPRSATVMIPGTTSCYQGWTIEYTGYLMTNYYNFKGGADYACVDKDPQAVYHGEGNTDGHVFYFTKIICGTLPCQEYPNGRELACAVCSK